MTKKEAIKELRDASDAEVRYGDTEHHYDEVMRRVEAFEKAIQELEKPERQHSYRKTLDNHVRWLYAGLHECARCGAQTYETFKYCPFCGAVITRRFKNASNNQS